MAAATVRVGETIRQKYRVDAFLATGTMANVYAATHRNGSRVALKILHKELATDRGMTDRFKREGYFANAINHSGVAKAIDDDITEDGCPFIVMELLEGETLEQRRQAMGGRIPVTELLPIADVVLDILASAHEKDVVHRDLKPDNVFLTKAGEVKVLDFGVARWNDGQESSDMTGIGMVLGTPAFMPPEQALGRRQEVDARSDIWALGATLFVCLSGESVHAGGDAKAKLIATARTPARPLLDAAPDVPRVIASVIDRALMFDRDSRWPDANAMRQALKWVRRGDMNATGSMAMTIPDPPSQTHVPTEPPPVPTRRMPTDDEPTVARAAMPSRPPEDVSLMSSMRNDPVFSLRREKPSIDDGPETIRKRPDIMIADAEPRSIEVNMSFTRPMAAVVVPPELQASVLGDVIDPHKSGTLPGGYSAPFGSDLPPPSPDPEHASAPPVMMPEPPPPAFPQAHSPSGAPPYTPYNSSTMPPQNRGGAVQEMMVARKSGQGLRVALIVIGALVVIGAGAFVVVKKPLSRSPATPATATATADTIAAPTPSASVVTQTPSTPSSSEPAVAPPADSTTVATAPKKPKKPKRPKPPVAATATEPTGDPPEPANEPSNEPKQEPAGPDKAPEKAPDPPPETNPQNL